MEDVGYGIRYLRFLKHALNDQVYLQYLMIAFTNIIISKNEDELPFLLLYIETRIVL
jgi:hypothetical protein